MQISLILFYSDPCNSTPYGVFRRYFLNTYLCNIIVITLLMQTSNCISHVIKSYVIILYEHN